MVGPSLTKTEETERVPARGEGQQFRNHVPNDENRNDECEARNQPTFDIITYYKHAQRWMRAIDY